MHVLCNNWRKFKQNRFKLVSRLPGAAFVYFHYVSRLYLLSSIATRRGLYLNINYSPYLFWRWPPVLPVTIRMIYATNIEMFRFKYCKYCGRHYTRPLLNHWNLSRSPMTSSDPWIIIIVSVVNICRCIMQRVSLRTKYGVTRNYGPSALFKFGSA